MPMRKAACEQEALTANQGALPCWPFTCQSKRCRLWNEDAPSNQAAIPKPNAADVLSAFIATEKASFKREKRHPEHQAKKTTNK